MSDARDHDIFWQEGKGPRKGGNSSPAFIANEELGQMHYSTENYSIAIEYLRKALDDPRIPPYPERFRVRLRISDCYRRKGDFKEARSHLERARAELQENPSGSDLGKLEYREASLLLVQGDYEGALDAGFSAYRRLKDSDEHGDVADIQILLANCYHRLGLLQEAEEFFMDALSSYRRIEDRVGIAYVYNNLGLLHKNACRWRRALASLSKSLELAENLGLTQHMIRVQLNLGIIYAKLRRFTDALAMFNSAATGAERFGDREKLTKAILMMGRIHVKTGDLSKAEKAILRAQSMANEYGYAREAALADEYLGELMMARGKLHEALVNLNNGLRRARKIAPEGDVTAEILRRLGDVHFHLDNHQKALALIEEGLETANGCGELYELGYFYRTRGLCLGRTGHLDDAIDSLKTSVETFDRYGNPYEKYQSLQLLARYYVMRRDQEALLKAKSLLNESIVGFSKIEDARGQILSNVVLASIELKLGNTDDALLAVYEAERLLDDRSDEKLKKVLAVLRSRAESQIIRTTSKVIDQFSVFGQIHAGARSRERLVESLGSTLKLIVNKAGADGGFIAIRSAGGRSFDIVARSDFKVEDARVSLAWYGKQLSQGSASDLLVTDTGSRPEMDFFSSSSVHPTAVLFQKFGFEDEDLGRLFLFKKGGEGTSSFSQDVLHFIAAYTSLISLSVYELSRRESRRRPKTEPSPPGFSSVVTDNREMIRLLNLAERVAHSDATVLLQGETGTGKGLIAYAIHLLSERRDKRFIHVNCAALPETLLESELFGHVRGSFTGAIADKDGLLKQADGGTIFLDEISKTSLAMQGKLLQFLDTGKVRRVGSNDLTSVNVRVICASKIDLLKLCEEGRFLEDLFYRINDFPLTIPPLRERREDIPLLADYYVKKLSSSMGKVPASITPEAMDVLLSYRWPGNVRELEKVIKRAMILADEGEDIDLCHLPPEMVSRPRGLAPTEGSRTLREKIAGLERREILEALRRHRGNKSRAARELGVSYPSFLAKMKRYGLGNS